MAMADCRGFLGNSQPDATDIGRYRSSFGPTNGKVYDHPVFAAIGFVSEWRVARPQQRHTLSVSTAHFDWWSESVSHRRVSRHGESAGIPAAKSAQANLTCTLASAKSTSESSK